MGSDLVDDTPNEATPAIGCPAGRDTCPDAGVDPIRESLSVLSGMHSHPNLRSIDNFMAYTDDSCMTNFTPVQGARLAGQIATYRGIV